MSKRDAQGYSSVKTTAVASSATASVDNFEEQRIDPPSPARPLHIIFAFIITFVPLVLIAILLCLFVSLPYWTIYNPDPQNAALPIEPLDTSTFLTSVYSSKFILTVSWTSNIAQFATAPFMLLFSFLVAFELADRYQESDEENETVKRLLQGDKSSLLAWVLRRFWHGKNNMRANGLRAAGVGALVSLILTLLLLAGDKLLQANVSTTSQRVYDTNVEAADRNNTSFMLNGNLCSLEDPIPDPYNFNVTPPCSINRSTNPWTLIDSPKTTRVLASGLLNQTEHFNDEDFTTLAVASDLGAFDEMQVVTYIDNKTADLHVFAFNPVFALEENVIEDHAKLSSVSGGDLQKFGIDYIAKTTSVVTKCLPITGACGMRNLTNSNTTTMSYQCSDIFKGDLGKIPTNGLEQLKGWNTSFYTLDDGSPRAISVASHFNPFTYNITAVVHSIDFGGLVNNGDPQIAHGTIVDMGNSHVAFALSCESSVYNVDYSFVNGSIYQWNATLADPAEAAIIKAPLQAGFGSYELFEKASLSVILNQPITVMDGMGLFFSQNMMALAAGAYTFSPSTEQRYRADITLTAVPKVPFYFLVVCLFLYALVILVFTGFALAMRRSDVLESQARLVPRVEFGVTEGFKTVGQNVMQFFGNDKK